MKKSRMLFVVFACFLAFSTLAMAECYINSPTLFFVDLDTLMAVDKVAAVSQAQAMPMAVRFMEEGKIIGVTKGTKVEILEEINQTLVIVNSNHYPYITFRDCITCR